MPKLNGEIVNEFDLLKYIAKMKDTDATQGYTSLYLSPNSSGKHSGAPKILLSGTDNVLYLYDIFNKSANNTIAKSSNDNPKIYENTSNSTVKICKGHTSSFYTKAVLSPCQNFCIGKWVNI